MRQINEYDQLTRLTKRVTLIKVVETDRAGTEYPREMNIRHALQACKVQPDRFRLAEKLPKGISLDMVPAGTTIKDVREFEKTRGTIGKVTKTQYDNVLDAIERGVELADIEVIDASPGSEAGSMMSDEAPGDYKPKGVDLTPADSMKDTDLTTEEKVLDRTAEQEPSLKEIKEKDLNFEGAADTIDKYTKQQLKTLPKEKLQAIVSTLPGYKTLAKKMQQTVMKAKKDPLIDTIVQLQKKK